MVIRLSEYRERVAAWIEENELDPYFGTLYPDHDAIHVAFDVPTTQEGLVLAIEELIQTEELGTEEEFTVMAKTLGLSEDKISEIDCIRMFERLEAVWPVTLEYDI